MKVLVVGQGGREHVLAWKLAQSPKVTTVHCAPGNAGTAADVVNVGIGSGDVGELVRYAQSEAIDLVVVGPEAPLVAGLVDALGEAGIRAFGPTRGAAELEGSKAFSKGVMRRANVPTADYHVFDNQRAAIEFVEERIERKHVVKADGLAAGKGVTVCDTTQDARDAINDAFGGAFGTAGRRVIIEERLEGQEASILVIVDGNTILPLEAAQDHKPAHDGDTGPNTGGMGAYSPTPLVTGELMDTVVEKILVPTVHQMKKEGRIFRGVLYAGLMMTPKGPYVLEYNVRFGDPEAQPVLMRLKTDLFDVLWAATEGKLRELPPLEWDDRSAVCVVMASEGYPGSYAKGHAMRGLADADALPDTKVFHAGTTVRGDEVVTDGGRVLGVTALGDDVTDAKLKAYRAVKCIRWDGAWCRTDISDKARGYAGE